MLVYYRLSGVNAVIAMILNVVILFGVLAYFKAVSYTHLRAHETVLDLVCRLLLEKKKTITDHTEIETRTNMLIHVNISS